MKGLQVFLLNWLLCFRIWSSEFRDWGGAGEEGHLQWCGPSEQQAVPSDGIEWLRGRSRQQLQVSVSLLLSTSAALLPLNGYDVQRLCCVRVPQVSCAPGLGGAGGALAIRLQLSGMFHVCFPAGWLCSGPAANRLPLTHHHQSTTLIYCTFLCNTGFNSVWMYIYVLLFIIIYWWRLKKKSLNVKGIFFFLYQTNWYFAVLTDW